MDPAGTGHLIAYLQNHLGREDRRHALLWALLLTIVSGMLVVVGHQPEILLFWKLENGASIVTALVIIALLWIDPAANHILGKFMTRGVPDDVQPEGFAHWLTLVNKVSFAPSVVWLAVVRSAAYIVAAWKLLHADFSEPVQYLDTLAAGLFLFLILVEILPLFGRWTRRLLVQVASGTYLGLVRRSRPGMQFFQSHHAAIKQIEREYPPARSQLGEATKQGVDASTGYLSNYAWTTKPLAILFVGLAGVPFLFAFWTASQPLWQENAAAALALVELILGLALAIRLLSHLLLDNSRALLDQLYHNVVDGKIGAPRIPWFVQVITAHQRQPLLHIHSLHQLDNHDG